MPTTVPEIIYNFYNCGGEWQTFACRLLTPIDAGLPHLARVCRYRARVQRLPACCCRLVAWYGAALERYGIREASLRYATPDTQSSVGLSASNVRAPAVSACLPPSAQWQRLLVYVITVASLEEISCNPHEQRSVIDHIILGMYG